MTEELRIMAIGESTSCGYYNGTDHKGDAQAEIPLMIKNAIVTEGVPCSMSNQAKDSTRIQYHLDVYVPGDLYPTPSESCMPIQLAENNATIVTIQCGLNDCHRSTPGIFRGYLEDIIENCKRAGKKVYLAMPNSIAYQAEFPLALNYLTDIAWDIEDVANLAGDSVVSVNSGVQNVERNGDPIHPEAGVDGYIALGSSLKNALIENAKEESDRVRVVGIYIACFNRTAEKGGLDFWTSALGNSTREAIGQEIYNIALAPLTGTEFITLLYNNLLNRVPDPGGLAYWLNELSIAGTNPQGSVMNDLIDMLFYETTSNQNDIDTYRHRVHCGLAYGYIYGITTSATNNNLAAVTYNPATVANFTANL